MLEDADGQPTDQIDHQNQQACDRVTADEFGRTVHGAEEVRFLRQLFAALFGGFLVNHAGVQVSVNRHLFTRHGVQGEARIDLRDPAGTLGHHNEVDDHQNAEDDETHHVIAADHDVTKSRHYLARSFFAFVAVDQHHAGRGHVQGQAQHRCKQQNRGKRRKLQRLAGADGDHDDQQTGSDVESEQDVQQPGRQGQHQHGHDQQHQRRNAQSGEVKAVQVLSDT